MNIQPIVQSLLPRFQKARIAHEQFTEAWNKHFRRSGQAYKESSKYQKLREYALMAEAEIDDIILPVIAESKAGTKTNLELALAYLAVPDRYFRSGYNKEAICNLLKRINLNTGEKKTVRAVWQSVQASLGGREKKAFIKLLGTFHDSLQ